MQQAFCEHARWPLWLAVALGAGVGIYFALPLEPSDWVGWLGFVLALGCVLWHRQGGFILLLIGALLLGFGAAMLRTALVDAPVLARRMGPVRLTGLVIEAETRGARGGYRLLLKPEPIFRQHGAPPARVRISVRHGDSPPRPGSFVRVAAVLMPPPGPAVPGGYDFARWAYFRRIGAVGYAYGRLHVLAPPRELTIREKMRTGLQQLRDAMTARITTAVPGEDGAIAAALITGERAAVSPEAETAYRDSGLTHVLSISGVHLALAGGIFFWAIRALLALFPSVVLRWPIKKWAAVAALLGSGFYLAISGADPPAVRSEIMLAAMFLAILADRPALSMRSVMLAAAVILLIEPESLTDPGCQMSFASVIGLIGLAEWGRAWRRNHTPSRFWLMRLLRYGGGIVAVSLIAGVVSAPIAIYHFDRASQYGLISNLIAEPVVGFIIMPAATAAMVLMPFGLEGAPLWLMGKSVSLMSAIAFWVAAMPGAGTLVPVWPLASLLAVMGGFLWIAFWLRPWRWLGLVAVAGGLLWTLTVRPPDILIARDFGAVAVRKGGVLHFLQKPKDDYAASDWLRREGDDRSVPDALAGDASHCDDMGCLIRADDGRLVAYDMRADALAEDCGTSALVISAVPAKHLCRGPVVVDRIDIWYAQGMVLWLKPWRVQSVAQTRGVRPWTQVP